MSTGSLFTRNPLDLEYLFGISHDVQVSTYVVTNQEQISKCIGAYDDDVLINEVHIDC